MMLRRISQSASAAVGNRRSASSRDGEGRRRRERLRKALPHKILTTSQWSRLSKDPSGASRARLAADALPVHRSFFARTRPYAKGQLAERERRHGSRPVLPSFLPFCSAHSYLVVLPQNRSVTFSPSSSSAQNQPRARHRRAAAFLLPTLQSSSS